MTTQQSTNAATTQDCEPMTGQKAQLDALLRSLPLDFGDDLAVQRPLLEQLMTSHPLPEDVNTTPSTLGGVPTVEITLPDSSAEHVLLYLHGGAYVMGSAAAAAGLAAGLSRPAGTRTVSVEYRLAPEHPFPAALEDAVAAYRGLLDDGISPYRIAIAGESAGGGLAIAALVAIRETGLPLPAAGVLMSPWTDLTLSGTSITAKAAADPAINATGLRVRAADYAGDTAAHHPGISPLFADLTGLPPLLIQVGTHEILLDDAIRLAATAAASDVSVTLDIVAGVPHVFQGFADILDEGADALTRAGAFISSKLDN